MTALARRFSIVLSPLLAASLLLSGCARSVTRRMYPPDRIERVSRESPFLKAHLRDGTLIVFEAWSYDAATRTVSGNGVPYDLHRTPGSSAFRAVPLDSVAVFETNVVGSSPAVGALALLTGVSLAVTAYCLSNPKACFGSCPTFYVGDGEGMSLMAEGFSASIAPAFEATDVDALLRARPSGRRVEVRMTNEALETHVVRHVDLLIAPRAPGERVFARSDGGFVAARVLAEPETCRGPEGDCRELIRALDGRERTSLADSTDLAAREEIRLSFPIPAGAPVGLVLVTRQSLMSTYLLYQALAWMGGSAGSWLARLERGDPALRARFGGAGGRLGKIEVEARVGDRWVPAGAVREAGPLAADAVLVPLPAGMGTTAELRLTLTAGMHRIDWLAPVALGRPAVPERIRPASVTRIDAPHAELRRLLIDPDSTLVTFPGDTCRIVYELPGDAEGYELFLESRGYYWEWIREEWLPEEDPAALARLLLRPEAALRELAPRFKAVEPEMEDVFWGSRYARP